MRVILAPVNIAQIDCGRCKKRDDDLQNQNLSKNVTLCCAQERKVRFYLGNTQKKSVLQTSTQTASDGPNAFESRGVANGKSDAPFSNTSANCAGF